MSDAKFNVPPRLQSDDRHDRESNFRDAQPALVLSRKARRACFGKRRAHQGTWVHDARRLIRLVESCCLTLDGVACFLFFLPVYAGQVFKGQVTHDEAGRF